MSDAFLHAYLECAIWSSTAEDGRPLEWHNYDISDLSPEDLEQAREDCEAFQADNAEDLAQAGDNTQNGHDFWLTRNRHGAGFWDRGYGPAGDRLTAAAHAYGSCDVLETPDGLLEMA